MLNDNYPDDCQACPFCGNPKSIGMDCTFCDGKAHCTKCGDAIESDEDSLCGGCV